MIANSQVVKRCFYSAISEVKKVTMVYTHRSNLFSNLPNMYTHRSNLYSHSSKLYSLGYSTYLLRSLVWIAVFSLLTGRWQILQDFFVYLFVCLSVYLSICLSVYLSICLFVYLSIFLSVFLSNYKPLSLSCLFTSMSCALFYP